ncbi:MAG: DUF1499 domain-containing protein [Motiliproteus sp.]|nr:DUF1499 domain-containing protein [Motiliproteus sp.]
MVWYTRLAAIGAGLLVVLLVVVVLLFFVKASESRRGDIPGMSQGQLQPCPTTPNCVSSEMGEVGRHQTEPLALSADDPKSMQRIKTALAEMGGVIMEAKPHYLSATFTSKVFGFVDDLEVRLDASTGTFHVRSASRVGHSDMEANSRRVAELREQLK